MRQDLIGYCLESGFVDWTLLTSCSAYRKMLSESFCRAEERQERAYRLTAIHDFESLYWDAIDMARSMGSDGHAVDLGVTVETAWNPLIRRIVEMPQPIIARVNGVAAGAGANVALAADIVVAARSAKFIQSFSAIGLVPDSGGSWVLPRLVGQARALGMTLTGEPLPAETAAEWGLIWKCVDDDSLDDEVDALAEKLASLPPLGLAATKKLIRSTWARTLEQELNEQRNEMRRLGYSQDYREGVAAFLEKRTPTFVGR